VKKRQRWKGGQSWSPNDTTGGQGPLNIPDVQRMVPSPPRHTTKSAHTITGRQFGGERGRFHHPQEAEFCKVKASPNAFLRLVAATKGIKAAATFVAMAPARWSCARMFSLFSRSIALPLSNALTSCALRRQSIRCLTGDLSSRRMGGEIGKRPYARAYIQNVRPCAQPHDMDASQESGWGGK
jgi:hypothetical protein